MSGATRVAAASAAGAQVPRALSETPRVLERSSKSERATTGLTPARQTTLQRPVLPVTFGKGKIAIGGHRGSGENLLPNGTLPPLRENTVASFQRAVQRGATFLEFDVQVTRDGVPVIWHDIWIQTSDAKGTVTRQLVRDTTLQQFKSLVCRRATACPTQLMRNFKTLSGAFLPTLQSWRAAEEEELPTLAEVFAAIPEHVGFDIELKTTTPSNWLQTPPAEVARLVEAVTRTVQSLSQGSARPVAFSSFDPDVCHALHNAQSAIPVLLLTSGGTGFHCDPRRTSVEAAIAVALDSCLQGLVVDSQALLQHRHAVQLAHSQGLHVLTYGLANNDPLWVQQQQALGVQAAIVDNVAAVAATIAGCAPTALTAEAQK